MSERTLPLVGQGRDARVREHQDVTNHDTKEASIMAKARIGDRPCAVNPSYMKFQGFFWEIATLLTLGASAFAADRLMLVGGCHRRLLSLIGGNFFLSTTQRNPDYGTNPFRTT